MSKEFRPDSVDEELARQILELESQTWLGELRSLEPETNAANLYALGLAVGQQSIVRANLFSWQSIRLAACSSVLSMAATGLFMLQFSRVVNHSTSQRQYVAIEPIQSDTELPVPNLANSVRSIPETTEVDLAAGVPYSLRGENKNSWSESKMPESSVSQPIIEWDRLRYVSQRQRWLAELPRELGN